MRTRAKALTVTAAMVATFAILPVVGASAAEPLRDGAYDVTVGDTTYTVGVVNGMPVVEDVEGVEFSFDYDGATGRVLDEFEVTVDGAAYDVDVAEDGTATVVPDGEEPSDDGASEDTDDGEDTEEGEAPEAEAAEEGDDDEDDEDADDEDAEADDEDAEADEDDGAHGELVSTVAQCAPRGKVAREAGLPNHGTYVRAAAQGGTVDLEVDGETVTVDVSTPEGAAELCEVTAALLEAAAAEADADAEAADAEGEDDGEDDDRRGKGKDKDKDKGERGRSGDAPGRNKDR